MQVGGKTTRLFLLQSSFQERNPSVTLSNIKQPAENKNCRVAHLSLAPIKQLEFFFFFSLIYIWVFNAFQLSCSDKLQITIRGTEINKEGGSQKIK
jgi:hypothetical protein